MPPTEQDVTTLREETDFDDHDVTLWFVGGNTLKCAAGCQVEVVSAPVAAGIKVKG